MNVFENLIIRACKSGTSRKSQIFRIKQIVSIMYWGKRHSKVTDMIVIENLLDIVEKYKPYPSVKEYQSEISRAYTELELRNSLAPNSEYVSNIFNSMMYALISRVAFGIKATDLPEDYKTSLKYNNS